MSKYKIVWFLTIQRSGSGSYQRIRKLMEDFGLLFESSVVECTFTRIPLSVSDIVRLFKLKPMQSRHKQYVFPLLLPGARFGFIRAINRFTLKFCGRICGLFIQPDVVIGEYASMWPSVSTCAMYRRNVVKWIDIHGAQPEEAIYTHPHFKNIKKTVDDMRRAEENTIAGADILTVQSDVMSVHLSNIHKRKVSAISYQCGVDTGLFVSDPEVRKHMRGQLRYLTDDCVFVYAGGTAKWQLLPQTLRLIAALYAMDTRCKGLILTPSNHTQVLKLAESCGLAECAFRLLSAEHYDMPKFLAASDIGILLRVDSVVNRVACPTKLGEYLACGLPIIAGPAAHSWSWLKSPVICHIVENLDRIDEHATAVLSFAQNVLVNKIAIHDICRNISIQKLSRNRDRVELENKVLPLIYKKI